MNIVLLIGIVFGVVVVIIGVAVVMGGTSSGGGAYPGGDYIRKSIKNEITPINTVNYYISTSNNDGKPIKHPPNQSDLILDPTSPFMIKPYIIDPSDSGTISDIVYVCINNTTLVDVDDIYNTSGMCVFLYNIIIDVKTWIYILHRGPGGTHDILHDTYSYLRKLLYERYFDVTYDRNGKQITETMDVLDPRTAVTIKHIFNWGYLYSKYTIVIDTLTTPYTILTNFIYNNSNSYNDLRNYVMIVKSDIGYKIFDDDGRKYILDVIKNTSDGMDTYSMVNMFVYTSIPHTPLHRMVCMKTFKGPVDDATMTTVEMGIRVLKILNVDLLDLPAMYKNPPLAQTYISLFQYIFLYQSVDSISTLTESSYVNYIDLTISENIYTTSFIDNFKTIQGTYSDPRDRILNAVSNYSTHFLHRIKLCKYIIVVLNLYTKITPKTKKIIYTNMLNCILTAVHELITYKRVFDPPASDNINTIIAYINKQIQSKTIEYCKLSTPNDGIKYIVPIVNTLFQQNTVSGTCISEIIRLYCTRGLFELPVNDWDTYKIVVGNYISYISYIVIDLEKVAGIDKITFDLLKSSTNTALTTTTNPQYNKANYIKTFINIFTKIVNYILFNNGDNIVNEYIRLYNIIYTKNSQNRVMIDLYSMLINYYTISNTFNNNMIYHDPSDEDLKFGFLEYNYYNNIQTYKTYMKNCTSEEIPSNNIDPLVFLP